ncbi:monothiol glutaredoxin-S10-like [Apium graveolens]|uniref:monothiol glutaredoxin-S10-like n=1 Tax=Apium graveolens TaxID=4045 RepID=UPI003D791101
MAATCNNICKAATSLALSITTPSLSTSSSHLLLPSLSLLPKSSRNLSTSSFKLSTHVVKNPGRVSFRVMSSLSDSELEGTVKKTISDYPVVVYSKSWCSYSSQVKQLFKKLGVQPHVVELDQLGAQGSQLQDVLGDLTEQYTVPNVFIGAKHIGGCSDTVELYQKGELENLLSEAGAKNES